jgi:hypothetical protein
MQPNNLTFLGLHSHHKFDKFYSSGTVDIANGVFNGFKRTRIFFDTNSTSWKIILTTKPDMYAERVLVEKQQSLVVPLGTHRFKPSPQLGGDHFDINMNVCNDDKEYNCHDGTCIQMDER